jgi:hypothetical protein
MSALARLHAEGLRVRVGPAGKLQAAPVSKLTPALAELIRQHADDIRASLHVDVLERFATSHGIDWPSACSQMIPGDAEAGAAQLSADTGDGIEHAGVACWLRLLAERAPPPYEAWPTGYRAGGTGLDAYGRPLPPARASVTCGSCQHFQRDPINPVAGAGICGAGVGPLSVGPALHPMAPRNCEHHRGLALVAGA